MRPESKAFAVWDAKERGLALRIAFGASSLQVRVLTPRQAAMVSLADARRIAARLRAEVAEWKDPLAERQAQRGSRSFAKTGQ